MIKYINVLTGPFLLAFIIALFLTPLTIVLARKINAVDHPKSDRKIHVIPMPRLGGIAIFIGTMVSMFYFTNYPKNIVIGISIGAIIIVITGILDDIYDLPATVKLVLQIIAAISVVAFGVQIEIFTNYFGNNF
jgi:UDP-GlcNAc:undecaprenyl-phosphate GlcNAc-1-phosphate transferase